MSMRINPVNSTEKAYQYACDLLQAGCQMLGVDIVDMRTGKIDGDDAMLLARLLRHRTAIKVDEMADLMFLEHEQFRGLLYKRRPRRPLDPHFEVNAVMQLRSNAARAAS